MTLTNMDCSVLSMRKRNKALAAWNVTNVTAVAAGTSVRQEQPTYQSSQIITQRNLGKVACGCIPSADGLDASTKNYPFNGLSVPSVGIIS